MIRILTGLLFRWWKPAVAEVPEPAPGPSGGGGGGGRGKKRSTGGNWKIVPNTDIFKLRIPISVQVDAPLPETAAVARIKYRVEVKAASEQQAAVTESEAAPAFGSLTYAGVCALFAEAEAETRARLLRQDEVLISLLSGIPSDK